MAKAKQDTLALLHEKVAKKLLEMVNNPDATAQDIAQAIKFLKDNNIQADPELNDAVGKLKEEVDVLKLPFNVNN